MVQLFLLISACEQISFSLSGIAFSASSANLNTLYINKLIFFTYKLPSKYILIHTIDYQISPLDIAHQFAKDREALRNYKETITKSKKIICRRKDDHLVLSRQLFIVYH
uniref:Secreted protein n=1 Tax=Heterorhabditis bacteriophora TaxID=37862 RepID=A0A1I7WFI5_HETBA